MATVKQIRDWLIPLADDINLAVRDDKGKEWTIESVLHYTTGGDKGTVWDGAAMYVRPSRRLRLSK